MNTEEIDREIKRDYELAFLLNTEDAFGVVLKILKEHGITPVYQSQVNQIKLAYPIKKHESAFFGFLYFEAAPEVIEGIKSGLSLNAQVVRFLIVTPFIKLPSPQMRPTQKSPDAKPSEMAATLSNEALEQKLEEILK